MAITFDPFGSCAREAGARIIPIYREGDLGSKVK